MNQFSVFEALDLYGVAFILVVGMFYCAILIIFAFWEANNKLSCGWNKSSVASLILGLVGIILLPLYFGWLSYTSINTEYNAIMSADENREYTALDIYKDFGIEKPDGTYQIDLSNMDKELYSRIKRDGKDLYEFIIKKVPDDSDKEAK